MSDPQLEPPKLPNPEEKRGMFREGLRTLINIHSRENRSDTPDFILSVALERFLTTFEECIKSRDAWHGFKPFDHAKPGDRWTTDMSAIPVGLSCVLVGSKTLGREIAIVHRFADGPQFRVRGELVTDVEWWMFLPEIPR